MEQTAYMPGVCTYKHQTGLMYGSCGGSPAVWPGDILPPGYIGRRLGGASQPHLQRASATHNPETSDDVNGSC